MNKFLKAILFITLIYGPMVAYLGRYDFGLVKGKFTAGQCVTRDLSDEFNRSFVTYRIIAVGKKEYDMIFISPVSGEKYSSPSGRNKQSIDADYQLTDCSKINE